MHSRLPSLRILALTSVCFLVPFSSKSHSFESELSESQDRWVVVDAVLQVEADPNTLGSIHRVLSSAAYIGSLNSSATLATTPVAMNLLNAVRDGMEPQTAISSSRLVVATGTVDDSLFSVSVAATDRGAARDYIARLVENLRKIPEGQTDAARMRVELANEYVQRARAETEDLRERMAEVRREAGGIDPSAWADHLQMQLLQSRSELLNMQSGLSIERSLREYQAERCAEVERTVEQPGNRVSNPEMEKLQIELSQLAVKIDSTTLEIREISAPGGLVKQRLELQEQLTDMQLQFAELEQRLKNTPQTIEGMPEHVTNPAFVREQQRLLDYERKIAESTARVAALQDTIDRTAHELRSFEEIAFTQRRINRMLDEAEKELRGAEFEQAEAIKALRQCGNASVSVLSGSLR